MNDHDQAPRASVGLRIPKLGSEARLLLLSIVVALPALLAWAVTLALVNAPIAVWVGLYAPLLVLTLGLAFHLRQQIVLPLYMLSNLLEALRNGDFSLRGRHMRRGDAVDALVREFNSLSESLRQQRLRAEEALLLLTKVLATVDIAIFAFDAQQRLQLTNPSGERLLAEPAATLIGRSAGSLGLEDVLQMNRVTVQRQFPGSHAVFEIRSAPFREGGVGHRLLAITDLTYALREEERRAWHSLIRVLAHELNNSLTPIKSMSTTLHEILSRQPLPTDWQEDTCKGLSVIAGRADALARFVARYAALAKLPPPQRQPTDLQPLLERCYALESRVLVLLQAASPMPLLLDADQIELALTNLLRNAAEAAEPLNGTVRVHARIEGLQAIVDIIDDGAGLAATDNLFVPFFTTKTGGSGIGLVLARQIIEAHGGSLSLRNRDDAHGCVARIHLPLPRVDRVTADRVGS